ncbi:tRNA-specific adenosine deaminase [Anatilimnocola aggregata]|uniref:tRNA-specific adenosine deaminase n=1 Tax=Anatilimnocola aggregata TaxID=2528021 RepID=A0A517YHM5_9BACT|nr:nucleoside deaminase [Anatilimnocola aggregata]QDU29740.1 tRNA-specific adenosine deaminase [Anatilimnocola aggregata]
MTANQLELDRQFLAQAVAAVDEALRLEPRAIPIGAVLVIDGVVRASGTNQRIQQNNPILHGETSCLQNTGTSITEPEFARSTLYTTLSPCYMCAGAALRFKIPRVVVAENRSFQESELLLRALGVEVTVLDDEGCYLRMKQFIEDYPDVWFGDITYIPPRPQPDYSQLDPALAAKHWRKLGFVLPQDLEP